MKISLELDKETLLGPSVVQYKYAVLQNNKTVMWEFVPRKVTFGDHANRLLLVPKNQIQQLTGMLRYFVISPLICQGRKYTFMKR